MPLLEGKDDSRTPKMAGNRANFNGSCCAAFSFILIVPMVTWLINSQSFLSCQNAHTYGLLTKCEVKMAGY